jgi:hypothetical protein
MRGTFRPTPGDAIRKLAPWLPAIVVLATAILRSSREWGDFGGYAIAGEAFRAGRYSDASSNNWPPFFSLLAAPLSLLAAFPPRAVRIGWALFSSAVLALSSARFFRKLYNGAVPSWAAPAAALLVSPFWIAHIVHHQFYAFVLAACAEGFFAAERGQDLRAGIWIGLAAAAKVTPALTLAYFLFTRRLRVVGAAVATVACCSLLTVPALGAGGAIDAHLRWMARVRTLHGTIGDRNQSLEALTMRWTAPGNPPDVAGVGRLVPLSQETAIELGSAVAAALVVIAALACARGGLRPLQAFAPLVAVSVFAAPYCWRSQMVALFPLLLALTARIAQRRSDWIDVAVLAAFAMGALLREPGITGPSLYQRIEGAGLTAITYLLVVANALRRSRIASERQGQAGGPPMRPAVPPPSRPPAAA